MEKLIQKLRKDLKALKFTEFFERTNDCEELTAVMTTKGSVLSGLFGTYGLTGIIELSENIKTKESLEENYKTIRKAVVKNYAKIKMNKHMHSFFILFVNSEQFSEFKGIESNLKDKTGLHVNIVQGVFIVDKETKEYVTDYTKPAQHKKQYNAIKKSIDIWTKS